MGKTTEGKFELNKEVIKAKGNNTMRNLIPRLKAVNSSIDDDSML